MALQTVIVIKACTVSAVGGYPDRTFAVNDVLNPNTPSDLVYINPLLWAGYATYSGQPAPTGTVYQDTVATLHVSNTELPYLRVNDVLVDTAANKLKYRNTDGSYSPVGGGGQEWTDPWRYPRFISVSTSPVARTTDFPGFPTARMFRPIIVKASGRVVSPPNSYYMYGSTDHGTTPGNSGIYLWTGPTPQGPWTAYGTGPVYTDSDGGLQTEFPSVIWDPDERQFRMYYIYNIQTTAMAVSPDGITWEKVSSGVFHGAASGAYTGYPAITRVGPFDWWAHHLLFGAGAGWYTCSRSRDGIQWVTDPVPTAGGAEVALDNSRTTTGPTQIFQWDGRPWGLSATKRSDTAGGQPGDQETVAGPISTDYRSFVTRPQQIWTPSNQWELGIYHSGGSIFHDDDDSLYLTFRGGDGTGFGVAKCVGGHQGVGGS